MKYEIKNLVNEIFSRAPESKKATDLKEEIYQNLSDRYDELIHSGKSDREAMDAIRSVMGDFTPLIEELGDKGAINSGTHNSATGDGTAAKTEQVNVFPEKSESGRQAGNSGYAPIQNQAGGAYRPGKNNGKPKKRMSGTAKAWIITLSILLGLLIISGIVASLAHRIWNSFDFGEFYISGNEHYSVGDASISADEIDSISVKWIAGNVDVKFVAAETISISEESSYEISKDMQMHYRVNDGVLEIMYGRSRNIFFGFWGRDYSKDLTIELPVSMNNDLKNMIIDSVSANVSVDGQPVSPDGMYIDSAPSSLGKLIINSVSGNVNVDCLIASTSIDIQTVSGRVNIVGTETKKINAGTVSGYVNFNGKADDIIFESVSGGLLLQIPTFNSFKADTTSGEVKIIFDFSGISGFTTNFDSISGTFKSDYPTTVSGSRYTNGDGSALIDFDSVSGGLTITYSGTATSN